jgi:hypothetical protein
MSGIGHRPREPLLVGATLFSGVALVVSVVSEAPLGLVLPLLGSAAVGLIRLRWVQSSTEVKARLRAQLLTGLVAGLLATAAYDLGRLALVWLGRLPLSPFATWGIFGELIAGDGTPSWLRLAVGSTYHVLNGVTFAIGYCLLLGGRGWGWGVLWGLGLEAAMLALYPGWLDLDQVMAEFVTMSFVGHLLYGSVLGVVAQRRLAWLRSPRYDESAPA